MSAPIEDLRGALGRLTRSALHRAKGMPAKQDMDDSSALSAALSELESARTLLPKLVEALELTIRVLEDAGNHFDHDNTASAQDAVARYFELWADDDRNLITLARRKEGV